MLTYETLQFIWLLIIAALFIGFAITGGCDLGVNALHIFIAKEDKERQQLISSLSATWEGNQVWLITAAAALFAAWPLMYASVFSSFYLALLLVLLALILRPPGLDYRSKLSSVRWRSAWDVCLFISGFVPLFLFGVAFGNLLSGLDFYFDTSMRVYSTSGFFSLLNPFSLLVGVVALCLLLLQGALFIQIKTHPPLSDRAAKFSPWFAWIFIIGFVLAWYLAIYKLEGFQWNNLPAENSYDASTSAASYRPFAQNVSKGQGLWMQNYLKYPLGFALPILSIIFVLVTLFFSKIKYLGTALFFNSLALVCVICTFWFTLYPLVLPSNSFPMQSLTIWNASSSALTLKWMLVAVIIFLPIILAYTTWVFRVVKGKVATEEMDTKY